MALEDQQDILDKVFFSFFPQQAMGMQYDRALRQKALGTHPVCQ